MDRYCRKDWMVPNKIQESADLLYETTCRCVGKEEPSFEDWKEAFPYIWNECKEAGVFGYSRTAPIFLKNGYFPE